MVDMVQVLYDSLGVVVLVVSVAPCIARSPTRLVQQQQQCVQAPHASTLIYMYYLVYSLRTYDPSDNIFTLLAIHFFAPNYES